jgi:hypothetical protein
MCCMLLLLDAVDVHLVVSAVGPGDCGSTRAMWCQVLAVIALADEGGDALHVLVLAAVCP